MGFKLTIWPQHCIIRSEGHKVIPVIDEALKKWCTSYKREVEYITKGKYHRLHITTITCSTSI